jgi:UBA/TS-N domain/PUB domain/UBX domain
MFRKLSEGLASASDRIATALGSDEPKVRQLTSMGFDGATASQALQATNGNVDQAAELLLLASSASVLPGGPGGQHQQQQQQQQQTVIDLTGNDGRAAEDDDSEVMRRVLQQSVDDEQNRRQVQLQSAASRRAGEAALARAGARAATSHSPTSRNAAARTTKAPTNGKQPSAPSASSVSISSTASKLLAAHHPEVKVIPKLQDKSKEEQVLRCADRLKNSPQAVDTLLRALTTIRDHPHDDKYRTVDKSAPGYKRSMENAPGAEDMLFAMSFRRQHGNPHKLVLERSMVDPALLYLGISALEQTKETDEYKQLKRRAAFNAEVRQITDGSSSSSEEETKKRSHYRAMCPSEPPDGRGAVVQVRVGEQTTLRRRFDADDTLAEVLHWLGSHGSAIPERIVSREWCLVDLNHYPVAPLDPKSSHLTLQYLGCWPSGKLELLPSTDEWREGAKSARRTSRGLGSAPSDAL